MKKIVFSFLCLFLICSSVFSQTINGKFSIPRQANKKVLLYSTEGNYKYIIDSVKVKNEGSFAFTDKKLALGYYKLALGNENNIIDIILNPSENSVDLEFSQVRLERGINILNSEENKALWEYKKKEKEVKKTIKTLKKQRAKNKGDEIKTNEISNEINKKEKELFDFTQDVINKYPFTFFSKAMVASKTSIKEKENYFNDLDFNNEAFIRSKVFSTRFQEYIIKHSGHTEVGYYNTVDEIMKKAKVNEKVFEFALYNLLDGFYGSGLEDVATYIMEEYFYGEACGEIEINDLLRQKAELIKNLQIGNTPPDFTIKNNFDEEINLKNTCAKNEYTILMFWATHCPHCMRELPSFVTMYKKYKPKGLEIIGVALDVNPVKWKNTVEEKEFNWINVSQFKNYQSPVCKDYKINKTPSFFILDKEMKIVEKPKGKADLKRFLERKL